MPVPKAFCHSLRSSLLYLHGAKNVRGDSRFSRCLEVLLEPFTLNLATNEDSKRNSTFNLLAQQCSSKKHIFDNLMEPMGTRKSSDLTPESPHRPTALGFPILPDMLADPAPIVSRSLASAVQLWTLDFRRWGKKGHLVWPSSDNERKVRGPGIFLAFPGITVWRAVDRSCWRFNLKVGIKRVLTMMGGVADIPSKFQ